MASVDGEQPAKPLPQLSIEIWHNVFTFLSVQAEEASMYVRPEAEDLTRCMRVCSSWFLAAGKALYTPVVFTYTLPGFLLGFDVPIEPVAGTATDISTAHTDAANGETNETSTVELEMNDVNDARRLMAAGNFKRPLLRYVTRIVIISCSIESTTPEERANMVRCCTEDWDDARVLLSHPDSLLMDCLPNLIGIRSGTYDYSHDFRNFWTRNAWARYEPKDRGWLLLRALRPRYWCDSQSGFLYSLPCPTRVTDYEDGMLPVAYTYHATTAENFRVLWGTQNNVVYFQDSESNGPRNEGGKWDSLQKIADDVYERLVSLFPLWAPPYEPDMKRDSTLPQVIRDTTFTFQGIAKNWHWDIELVLDPDAEDPEDPLPIPTNPDEWAAAATTAKEKELRVCRELETILRERLRRRFGGTEELWEGKVKIYDTATHYPEANCPSCGAEWNCFLETNHWTMPDDRDEHTCSEECCGEGVSETAAMAAALFGLPAAVGAGLVQPQQ